jgi:hypothetical protein
MRPSRRAQLAAALDGPAPRAHRKSHHAKPKQTMHTTPCSTLVFPSSRSIASSVSFTQQLPQQPPPSQLVVRPAFTPTLMAPPTLEIRERHDDDNNDALIFDSTLNTATTTATATTPMHATDATTTATSSLSAWGTQVSSPSKSHRKRKSPSSSGSDVWSKKLQGILDRIAGNVVRLSSGHYPFSTTASLDWNDPRRRAQSHMNVTLLGQVRPGQEEDGLHRYLGYVHEHTTTQSSATTCIISPNMLAWIAISMLDHDKELVVGSQWRFYDSIAIPLSSSSSDLDDTSKSGDIGGIRWLITCAELREPYPSVLPPLPSIHAIRYQLKQLQR